MSDENDQTEPKQDQAATLSIIDLIIQEQMEKDALVLAPKPKKAEPEQVEVVEEQEPRLEQVEVVEDQELHPEIVELAEKQATQPESESEEPFQAIPSSDTLEVEVPPSLVSEYQAAHQEPEEPPAQQPVCEPAAVDEPPTEEPAAVVPEDETEGDDFELTEEERAELEEWGLELTEEELAELAELEKIEAEEAAAAEAAAEASDPPRGETTKLLLGPSVEDQNDVIELFKPSEPLAVGPPSLQIEQLGASADTLEEDIFDLFKPVEKVKAELVEDVRVTEPLPDRPQVTGEPAAQTPSPPQPPTPAPRPAVAPIEPASPSTVPELSEEAKTQVLSTSSKAVGGQLRELEQRLTNRLPAGLPEGIKKRSSAAMQYLATFSGIERGVVAVIQGEEWQVTAVGNLEREYLEKVPLRVLKSVLRTGESLLLLDATKDARYKQDPVVVGQGIKSVICVRFRDGVTGLQGVLYADNLEKSNAFSYQDLRGAEWFAQRLENDPVLQEYQTKGVETPKPEPETLQTEPVRTDPRLYLLVAAAMVMLVFPALSNPTRSEPKPEVSPVAVERVTADPKVVVLGFLRALETKNHRSAYNYLSSARKSQVEEETFSEAVRKFVTEKDNAWVISRLSILEDSQASGKTRSYKLIKPDETLAWRISVQETEGSWYISQIKGMSELSF